MIDPEIPFEGDAAETLLALASSFQPGSMLSSQAILNYGKAIRALRSFTQASMNKEPSWRGR